MHPVPCPYPKLLISPTRTMGWVWSPLGLWLSLPSTGWLWHTPLAPASLSDSPPLASPQLGAGLSPCHSASAPTERAPTLQSSCGRGQLGRLLPPGNVLVLQSSGLRRARLAWNNKQQEAMRAWRGSAGTCEPRALSFPWEHQDPE